MRWGVVARADRVSSEMAPDEPTESTTWRAAEVWLNPPVKKSKKFYGCIFGLTLWSTLIDITINPIIV